MKTLSLESISSIYLLCFISFFVVTSTFYAQDTIQKDIEYVSQKKYIVTKNDGSEFIGEILEDDGREILINTTALGKLYIPKHEIKSIKEVEEELLINGKLIEGDFFSTRYFLTTNGLTQKKGEHYALYHLFGPEVQFAVTNNITIGGLTSWIGMPFVLSVKYSIPISENMSIGTGVLAGSLSWANLSANGVLPYGALTIGNNRNNITFSGGGLFVQDENTSHQTALFSVAGMVRLGTKAAFIVDSFGFSRMHSDVVVVMPGLRFGSNKKAFQFGFTQIYVDEQFVPFPIPTIGWFNRF